MYNAVLLVNIIAFRMFLYICCPFNFSLTCRNPTTPAYSDLEEVPSFCTVFEEYH